MTMATLFDHPLVQAYLDDLDRALLGADPAERADIVASVREHLGDALPDAASDAQVRDALATLGPVEAIAAAAAVAGHTQPAPAAPIAPAAPRPRDTVAVALLACAVVSIALIPVPVVSLPVALGVVTVAVVRLAQHTPRPVLTWSALLLAAFTPLVSLVLGFFLLGSVSSVEQVSESVVQID